MSKTYSIKRFDGGISDDIRENSANKFAISKHFDIYSNPNRLVPFRSTEDDSGGEVSIGNFLYTSTGLLLGLGKVLGQNYYQIYWKTAHSTAWDNFSAWIGASGVVAYELFLEYNGFIYFWDTNLNYLEKADVAHTASLANFQSITTTYRTQGIVHSQTYKAYIPYSTSAGTFIGTIDDAGTWNAAAFTLSATTQFRIYSISEYGNFLAIAAYDNYNQKSKVFLWDVINEPTHATEIVDWGEGILKVINNLEGMLIGIAEYNSTALGASGATSKIVIKRYTGGLPQVIKEVSVNRTSTTTTVYQGVNFIKNNKLYFAAFSPAPISSETNIGIWTIGRKNVNYNFAVTLERYATNDNSETTIDAAIYLGDFMFIAHSGETGLTRTNDQPVFSAISVYESQIFDPFSFSHLDKVELDYTFPIKNAENVKLKYRIDNDTTWRQIFSKTYSGTDKKSAFVERIGTIIENTSDAVTISVASPAVVTLTNHGMNIGQQFSFSTSGVLPAGVTAGTQYLVSYTNFTVDSFKFTDLSGNLINTTSNPSQSGTHTIVRKSELPDFKEVQFRIESTGGAEITGLEFTCSEKPPQRG